MIRSIFTVSGLTAMSRVLGFVRDLLIARFIGAGPTADVWVAAFRLPNLFRRVFGEGAFNAAFVPMYSRRLEEEGTGAADLFARRTLSVMFALLVVLFLAAFVFMEPLVRLTNWGFEEGGRLEPAIHACRITIGYLVFICLVAAASGILNSRRVFGAPAFAYVALNLVFLAVLAVVVPRTGDPLTVLSWTVLASGAVQIAVVGIACLRRGVSLKPRLPVIDADMKRLGILMAPGLVSASVQQVNLLVSQSVATLQVGGSAVLYYADRLNQLPLGLVGMAMATVLLPEITRQLRGGDPNGAKTTLCRGMELSLLVCLPATVAMMVVPEELMLIFETGEFSPAAAAEAGGALAAFAVGTPAYVLARVLQPGYFAREDTQTPMRFTIIAAVSNMILVYPLFRLFGPMGCALATSIAAWVNFWLLWTGLRNADFMGLIPGFQGRVVRIAMSAASMGLVVWALAHYGEEWLGPETPYFVRMMALAVLVLIGIVVHFGAVVATRAYSVAGLKERLRRPADRNSKQ